jgi:hypothetical protein
MPPTVKAEPIKLQGNNGYKGQASSLLKHIQDPWVSIVENARQQAHVFSAKEKMSDVHMWPFSGKLLYFVRMVV